MTQDVQARTAVSVEELPASALKFSLPEDLLPADVKEVCLFSKDDPEAKFPNYEQETMREICATLLPAERCGQIDHITITRRRCRADNVVYTDFMIQTITEIGCTTWKARGRVDAALRACGYEPRLFES